MKIRERCICGSEFEIRDAPFDCDVLSELRKWRETHRCNQFYVSTSGLKKTEAPA